ncbi:hypothetical protein PUNSTDRAFT_144807 [Punctularia strigosozonata HHB-11173 SS5]|uniref:uncharacterized protein n=1 Tax=Punctularia strigosozonata (strain HHB-11173) TaxID=741275 RepID=UPI0004416ECA|nr:uncharacterized protein PUNSTDRAFT_144807 [Punctularia strigosozonata HHB-11173 SS5]EIN07292.1 hypothetical protein PUNSTDRAFT_144807 [Punctularia strigosozonata HHB-11173 SS5]
MITSTSKSREIAGVPTDVILQPFADRILVLITQLGKVGNLIQATIPATTALQPAPSSDDTLSASAALPPPPPTIQLTPLLGAAPSEHIRTLHSLYASQAATIIWFSENKEVLGEVPRRGVIVGVALKKLGGDEILGTSISDTERETFMGVMTLLGEMTQGRE